MAAANIQQEFFLSQVLGKPIRDARGEVIGCLRDMAIRWEAVYPTAVGIKYARHTQNHVATSEVLAWGERYIELRQDFAATAKCQLQADEIYVSKWLLDKQVIDINGSKLARVNDIQLVWVEQEESRKLLLTAVDIGVRGLLRRVGLNFFAKGRENKLLGWEHIVPLEARVADLRLRPDVSRDKIGQLRPADLADIIEDLNAPKRLELLQNLDNQTAAEALAEVAPDTRSDIIESLESSAASTIIQEMAPDEAADALGQVSREKSEQILNLMQAERANSLRKLMDYPADTAGALMTTEYLSFSPRTTAAAAIDRLRELAPSADTIYYLFVLESDNTLVGVVSLRQLIVAPPNQTLDQIMEKRVLKVNPRDNGHKAIEVIAKYDLLAVPVVDDQGIMLGIITVDDIIETLLPDRNNLETFSHYLVGGKLARRGRP
ncbi:MAG: CBS domain-containing protein [Clostridia bacterium]|nr:MAG: CBS domain-containing protein [Clostridia bacterium]